MAVDEETQEREFVPERMKIREHRLDTLLEWGLPLDVAKALMRAEYVPLYDVYKLRGKATPDQMLRVLL